MSNYFGLATIELPSDEPDEYISHISYGEFLLMVNFWL